MLKRENDFEKDTQIEEMQKKYNLDELFQTILLKEDHQEEQS